MNILFVCGAHLNCNSGIHTFNLANELVALGHSCAVAVPDGLEQTTALGIARFNTILAHDVDAAGRSFPDHGTPDLLHAWTPRERVRAATEAFASRWNCDYVVHLEDNEEHITEASLGRRQAELRRLPPEELDRLIPAHLSHPLYYKEFLSGSVGVSALLDTLLDFKPSGLPGCVFWPGADQDLPWDMPADDSLRVKLGIRPDEYVVAYTGNVHPANRKEVGSLYLAIALLNRRKTSVRLVRTGIDHTPLFDAEGQRHVSPHVIELGFIPRIEIPRVLSIADALVQPGRPDAFNDYRFPSKLPEFFSSGRLVILPKANLGKYVEDNVNCRLTCDGDAAEIARILEEVLPDEALRRRIGRGAKAFADHHFNWQASAHKVSEFYRRVLPKKSVQIKSNGEVGPDQAVIQETKGDK